MVLKLSTHTEKRWNICSKEKLSKLNISAHDSVLQGISKVKNGPKMKLKGGQKHKINNIEENNEVIVLQLHQYVLQVGRREKL